MASLALPNGTALDNKYRIVRVLGQGGFGVVYLGQTLAGQPVAVKQNLETSQDSRDQFRREAALVRPLQHPNLVRVEDYIEDPGGSQFLVMEFIAGDDLLQLAEKRSGPFPEVQVLRWGVILCGVLAYLHGQTPPIVHRDIKPQNVKTEQPGGRLVLVDFGIAKEFRPGSKTVAAARAFSDGFSPLEQYGTGTTTQSDLYALGATLFFLLTLQIPDPAPERAINHLPFNLNQLNGALSRPTVSAIEKAMEVNPKNRHASATEMQQALSQALQALGAALPPGATAPAPTLPPVTCPHCGTPNRSSARVCSRCGQLLGAGQTVPGGVQCPNCGSANRASARVCSRCGTPLGMPFPSRILSRPFASQSAASLASGQCPNCGQANSAGESFCLSCGYELPVVPQPASPIAPPLRAPAGQPGPASPRPWILVPQPGTGATQDLQVAGWTLFATGMAGLVLGLFLVYQAVIPILGAALVGLGILSALAGRDLLDLFGSSRYTVPAWLRPLFGDPNRGREWGTVAAAIWVIVGLMLGWLVLPLALAGGMAYVISLLIREPLVRSVGGHYARPGLVTLIGWSLALSGLGTVPGVALLIPKRWAVRWAKIALGAIVLLALAGVGFGLICLGASTLPWPLDFTWPGTLLHPLVFSFLTSCLFTIAGSFAASQYLDRVQLNYTQTAMRRELNVAAWTLFATGWATLMVSLLEINTPALGQFFWIESGIGLLAISSARDLLDLGSTWIASGSLLRGSLETGRRKGIIAALGLAIVSIILLKQIVPIVFLIIAVFILRVLMGTQAILVCGGKPTLLAGVTLIAWLLVPTGIGTIPGILMLNSDARGWRSARFALCALGLLGFVVAFAALASAMQNIGGDATLSWAVATSSAALAAASGFALRYLQSPVVRQYFRV